MLVGTAQSEKEQRVWNETETFAHLKLSGAGAVRMAYNLAGFS